jgi:hypothetical protein
MFIVFASSSSSSLSSSLSSSPVAAAAAALTLESCVGLGLLFFLRFHNNTF